MSKKLSSIEWLIGCISEDQMVKSKSLYEWQSIFEQAKAMHREEIKDTWNDGHTEGMDGGYCSTYEDYYNQTFGGQDNE